MQGCLNICIHISTHIYVHHMMLGWTTIHDTRIMKILCGTVHWPCDALKRRVLWTTYINLFSLTLKVNRADVNAVQYRPHTALFVRRPLHSYLSTDSPDGNFGKHDCTALTPSILYFYTSSWRMLFVVWLCLTHKVFYDVSDKHVKGSARTASRCRSRLPIQYHQASASNIKSYNRS